MDDTHVVPIGDLIEHETTRQCLCRPTVTETGPDTAVVAHHSYDGREYWDAHDEDDEPERDVWVN